MIFKNKMTSKKKTKKVETKNKNKNRRKNVYFINYLLYLAINFGFDPNANAEIKLPEFSDKF